MRLVDTLFCMGTYMERFCERSERIGFFYRIKRQAERSAFCLP